MISTGEETAEVAHEALIKHWSPLKAWLDEGAQPGMVLDAKVVPTVVAEWLEEAFRGH
jgi:hypothetical protein